jgi:hypothetical protein
MISDVTIGVVDANGTSIKGVVAQAGPGGSFGTTDSAGQTTIRLATDLPATFKFSHADYVAETVNFRSNLTSGAYDNSLVTRTTGGSGSVTLNVILGRLASAPVLTAGPPNGRAVLTEFIGNVFRYSYQSNLVNFGSTTPPVSLKGLSVKVSKPVLLKEGNFVGWDHFVAESRPFDLDSSGRFFWLLYPSARTPSQFAVAVWSPNLGASQPVSALDMVVFFCPNAAQYTVTYPFGASETYGQQYMYLGARYLLTQYMFVPELVANNNQAVVVMVIPNQSNWPPFNSGSALYRLLREVSVFLHRECRTSKLGVTPKGYDPSLEFAGGSLRDGPGISPQANFGAPPAVGKVAVSFFSSGYDVVEKLLQPSFSPAAGYDSALWNASPASQGAWNASWMELWDLDGTHDWTKFLAALLTWYKGAPDRQFWLCHSSGRAPLCPTTWGPLWKELKEKASANPNFPGPNLPWEYSGPDWSAVAFPNNWAISNDPSEDSPPLPSLPSTNSLGPDDAAHHNTAKIAFSHCIARTAVGKP